MHSNDELLGGTLCGKRHDAAVVMDNKHFIISLACISLHLWAWYFHLLSTDENTTPTRAITLADLCNKVCIYPFLESVILHIGGNQCVKWPPPPRRDITITYPFALHSLFRSTILNLRRKRGLMMYTVRNTYWFDLTICNCKSENLEVQQTPVSCYYILIFLIFFTVPVIW